MKKFLIALSLVLSVGVAFLALGWAELASAQITNPAIGDLGNNPAAAASGKTAVSYLVQLWRAVIFIGGLFVLLYLIWGAIEWITAGGDSSKITKARDRITQAVVGMIILVASFTIVGFISSTFFGGEFNLLNPVIPTPVNRSSGSTIPGDPTKTLQPNLVTPEQVK